MSAGSLALFPYRVSEKSSPEEYEGEFERKPITNFVFESFDNFALPIQSGTNVDIQRFLSSGEGPKLMLITNKEDIPPLMKAVSFHFRKRLPVGIVRSYDEQTMSMFQVGSCVAWWLESLLMESPGSRRCTQKVACHARHGTRSRGRPARSVPVSFYNRYRNQES